MLGLLRKAWRDITRRRLRSLLTILAISVGVAGMVAIVSTSRNLVRAQRQLYAAISQADIAYWVWEAPWALARGLSSDPRISAVELRITYVTRWRPARTWSDIELVGIHDWQDMRVNRFDLLEGAWPGMGELLVDVSAARAAGLRVGDEVAYRDPAGRIRYLKVSGISQSPSYLSSSITSVGLGYVPAAFLQRMLDRSGYNQLLIKLDDPEDAQAVALRVNQILRRQSIQAGSPAVRSPDTFAGKRELDALIMVMFLFSGVGLALSAFLVYNTLSASIAEQVHEIGILKAIGATRPQVLIVYLCEILILAALGSALGILLGSLAGWQLLVWIGRLGNASVSLAVAPEGLALGIVVGLGATLLGGIGPILQGTAVSVKGALEAFGIRAEDMGGAFGQWLAQLTHFSPLMALAVRDLGRRLRRSLATVALIALATAAFLGAVGTRDSVNAAIDAIYVTYQADAYIWLGEASSSQFEQLLRSVEGVHSAEAWGIADGHVGFADARLWGLPADTRLYRPVLRQGRWFDPHELDVIVVSAELADSQGFRVGDQVLVQAHGQMRTCTIVGVAVDNTIFLGGTLSGKAFMPRALLNRLLGQQDRYSLFAVGLASREPEVADAILADVEFKFARWRPTVQPVYMEVASAREASRLLTLALAAMVILVTLVGSLGVLNTLTLSVIERRREIAILRSMGATDAAMVLIFVTQGLALGLSGWISGLLLGIPAGRIFTAQLSRVLFVLDYAPAAGAIVASMLFTLALSGLTSLGPALAAAHLPTHVALRYE